MHQEPLQAPARPNRSAKARQRSGERLRREPSAFWARIIRDRRRQLSAAQRWLEGVDIRPWRPLHAGLRGQGSQPDGWGSPLFVCSGETLVTVGACPRHQSLVRRCWVPHVATPAHHVPVSSCRCPRGMTLCLCVAGWPQREAAAITKPSSESRCARYIFGQTGCSEL
jgi:hypothetical protein